MTAAALIAQLSGLGVTAWADGVVLRFKPKSLVPPDVLADMATHKGELLALLTTPPAAAVAVPVAVPAPSPLPHWPPGSWRARRYASDEAGDLWTTMQRPVSWADPDARPEEGAYCGNCECRHWVRDRRRADGGWTCSVCHPPDNVPVEHRDVVRW